VFIYLIKGIVLRQALWEC